MLNIYDLLKTTLKINLIFLLLHSLEQGFNKLTEECENFYSITFFFLIKLKVSWLFLLLMRTVQICALIVIPALPSWGAVYRV